MSLQKRQQPNNTGEQCSRFLELTRTNVQCHFSGLSGSWKFLKLKFKDFSEDVGTLHINLTTQT